MWHREKKIETNVSGIYDVINEFKNIKMNNELFLTELAKAMSVDGRVNVDAYSRVVRLIDDYTSINNSVNTPVSGSLPPTQTQILDEAQKHYEDCGISYPDSLVYMANWALSFGGNDH